MDGADGKRRHSRVRDDIPVNWYVDRQAVSGSGILRNLSVSGAMLETKTSLSFEAELLITLKAVESSEALFVPSLAKVIWVKAAREGKGYFFYGLEFRHSSDENLKCITVRVEEKMQSLSYGLGSGISDVS